MAFCHFDITFKVSLNLIILEKLSKFHELDNRDVTFIFPEKFSSDFWIAQS